MSKVVGARIDDVLYNKLKAADRPNTVIIREALTQYLFKHDEKNDVNAPITAVNNDKNKDRYKMIIKEIDKLLMDFIVF